MKKLFIYLFAFAFVFSVISCNKKKKENKQESIKKDTAKNTELFKFDFNFK